MLTMTEINNIRYLALRKGWSYNKICKETGHCFRTIRKYVCQEDFNCEPKPRKSRKSILDLYKHTIDKWLADDMKAPKKQRHTATRVFNRLREEFPKFAVSFRTVAYYVSKKKKELAKDEGKDRCYLPLSHPPGEAQVDFGMANFIENGKEIEGHYMVMSFPYSNASFVQVFRGENLECLTEGLRRIFEYTGGIPTVIWFDNMSPVVKKILKNGDRDVTKDFGRFQAHYGFQCNFCNPNSGHEKGSVENKVGYIRRNFFVPTPEFNDLEEYNRQLLQKVPHMEMSRQHYKKVQTIGQLFKQDKQELLPLPANPFDTCRMLRVKANKYGHVKFENNTYSTAPQFAQSEVWLKATHNQVIVLDDDYAEIVAHERIYGKNQESIKWTPYIPLIARRPNALKYVEFYHQLPDIWRNYLDSCEAGQKKAALLLLHEMFNKSSVEVANEALKRALQRGVRDVDSISVLWRRLIDPQLDHGDYEIPDELRIKLPVTQQITPNLHIYDRLLKGGGDPKKSGGSETVDSSGQSLMTPHDRSSYTQEDTLWESPWHGAECSAVAQVQVMVPETGLDGPQRNLGIGDPMNRGRRIPMKGGEDTGYARHHRRLLQEAEAGQPDSSSLP
jgi:transposase